jgi:hypothetical protein
MSIHTSFPYTHLNISKLNSHAMHCNRTWVLCIRMRGVTVQMINVYAAYNLKMTQ